MDFKVINSGSQFGPDTALVRLDDQSIAKLAKAIAEELRKEKTSEST